MQLAAEEWPPLAVDDHALGFLRERLLPPAEERERAERVPGDEGNPRGPPRARARPVDEDPDGSRQERGCNEPFPSDELLWRHATRDVHEPAPSGRPDEGEKKAPEHREPDCHALLRAHDRIPGKRERGHELE